MSNKFDLDFETDIVALANQEFAYLPDEKQRIAAAKALVKSLCNQ